MARYNRVIRACNTDSITEENHNFQLIQVLAQIYEELVIANNIEATKQGIPIERQYMARGSNSNPITNPRYGEDR